MHFDQLATLLAIVDEGSFDGAAFVLGITPSAVSQRIKALETEVGRVVIRRAAPCEVTDAGEPLLRMARQVALLESQVRADLGLMTGHTALSLAVNADSFATWLRPLLDAAAQWPDVALRFVLEDQDHSSRLLRRGEVVGAVTSTPSPVAGCTVQRLGVMRYLPVAAVELRDSFSAGGGVRWAEIPALQFNTKDDLQQQLLRDRAPGAAPRTTTIPSSEGFVAATLAGVGWAMLPEAQARPEIEAGRLVRLDAAGLDIELFWQCWRLETDTLRRLTRAIHDCATALH